MGEFNVNKSDGSLEQTAGMPSESTNKKEEKNKWQ